MVPEQHPVRSTLGVGWKREKIPIIGWLLVVENEFSELRYSDFKFLKRCHFWVDFALEAENIMESYYAPFDRVGSPL